MGFVIIFTGIVLLLAFLAYTGREPWLIHSSTGILFLPLAVFSAVCVGAAAKTLFGINPYLAGSLFAAALLASLTLVVKALRAKNRDETSRQLPQTDRDLQAGRREVKMRRWRAMRIVIGILVPAPVGVMVFSIYGVLRALIHGVPDQMLDEMLDGLSLPRFFLFMTLFGYVVWGVPCICYSFVVELAGLHLPIVRRNIIRYACFSAAILSLCVAIRWLISVDSIGLPLLAVPVGAIMGLILYPLTPTDSRHPDASDLLCDATTRQN